MADDEISLVELWGVLVRRRKTLAVVLALCVIIGGVTALTSVEQYEYSTTVELGHTVTVAGERALVEPAAKVQSKLKEYYLPLAVDVMKDSGSGYAGGVDVKVPRGSDLLVITSKGTANDEEAIHRLQTLIVDSMVGEHSSLTEDSLNAFQEEYALLESQLKDHKERVTMLKKLNAVLENKLGESRSESSGAIESPDAGLIQAVAYNTVAIMTGEHYLLDYQSRMLAQKIKLAQITPTRAEVVATRAQKPTGIGRLATLVLASIMGLFIGILAAFFHEFLGKARSARAN